MFLVTLQDRLSVQMGIDVHVCVHESVTVCYNEFSVCPSLSVFLYHHLTQYKVGNKQDQATSQRPGQAPT